MAVRWACDIAPSKTSNISNFNKITDGKPLKTINLNNISFKKDHENAELLVSLFNEFFADFNSNGAPTQHAKSSQNNREEEDVMGSLFDFDSLA